MNFRLSDAQNCFAKGSQFQEEKKRWVRAQNGEAKCMTVPLANVCLESSDIPQTYICNYAAALQRVNTSAAAAAFLVHCSSCFKTTGPNQLTTRCTTPSTTSDWPISRFPTWYHIPVPVVALITEGYVVSQHAQKDSL